MPAPDHRGPQHNSPTYPLHVIAKPPNFTSLTNTCTIFMPFMLSQHKQERGVMHEEIWKLPDTITMNLSLFFRLMQCLEELAIGRGGSILWAPNSPHYQATPHGVRVVIDFCLGGDRFSASDQLLLRLSNREARLVRAYGIYSLEDGRAILSQLGFERMQAA